MTRSFQNPSQVLYCWLVLLLVLAIFASSDFDVERAEIHHHRPSCTHGHEELERERDIGNISNAAGITRIIIKRGIHFTMRKRKSADDIFSSTRTACGSWVPHNKWPSIFPVPSAAATQKRGVPMKKNVFNIHPSEENCWEPS
jgi:hypothetical protein